MPLQLNPAIAAEASTGAPAADARQMIDQIVTKARAASRVMATLPTAKKNRALRAMAGSFRASAGEIKAENAKDLEAGKAAGLSAAMLDRLELNDKRIEAMAKALE